MRAAPNRQENPVLGHRGPRRGMKMPKMADFGAWRGENLPRQGRGGRKTGRNGAGRGEKADILPQMNANERKWGFFEPSLKAGLQTRIEYVVHASAWGFCRPGLHPRRDRGQNSPPAVKGWPTADPRAKNRERRAEKAVFGLKTRKTGIRTPRRSVPTSRSRILGCGRDRSPSGPLLWSPKPAKISPFRRGRRLGGRRGRRRRWL